MTLHRAFVSQQFLAHAKSGTDIEIPDNVVHRLVKVLRVSKNTRVELFDGKGTVVCGHVLEAENTRFFVDSVEHKHVTGVRLTLVQALVKQDKLEEIVQHSTELGVHQFILFSAKNSIVKETQRTAKQIDRLQKIATEASRQCERFDIPDLVGPLTFKELEGHIKSERSLIFIGEPREASPLRDKLSEIRAENVDDVFLIIGPEGGLHATEISSLSKIGAQTVSYAPYVLRTQTAGLVGMSIIQSFFT